MRNLKKFLALVLAMMMVFSLMVTVSAASASKYADEYTMLEHFGIFIGAGTVGNDALDMNYSRAQMATVAYRLMTGDKNGDLADSFRDYAAAYYDDVNANDWYAGYVGWCTNAGIVIGVGDDKFAPNVDVTGFSVALMLLRALGYDAYKEITNSTSGWEYTVGVDSARYGILGNVNVGQLTGAASRGLAAYLTYRAATIPSMVEKAGNGVYTDTGYTLLGIDESTGEDYFGAPSTVYNITFNWWKVDPVTRKVTVADTAIATFYDAYTQCDVADLTEIDYDVLYTYTNGAYNESNNVNGAYQIIDELDTVNYIGAQGRETSVYEDRIVYKDTVLAKVTDVIPAQVDSAGHVIQPSTSKVRVYGNNVMEGLNGANFAYATVLETSSIYYTVEGTFTKGSFITANILTGTTDNTLDSNVCITDASYRLQNAKTISPVKVTVKGIIYDNTTTTPVAMGFEGTNGQRYYYGVTYGFYDGGSDVTTLDNEDINETFDVYTYQVKDSKGTRNIVLGINPASTADKFGVVTGQKTVTVDNPNSLSNVYAIEYSVLMPDKSTQTFRSVDPDDGHFYTAHEIADDAENGDELNLMHKLVWIKVNDNAPKYYTLIPATSDQISDDPDATFFAGDADTLNDTVLVDDGTVFFVANYKMNNANNQKGAYSFTNYDVYKGFKTLPNDMAFGANVPAIFDNGTQMTDYDGNEIDAMEVYTYTSAGAEDVGPADYVLILYATEKTPIAERAQKVEKYAYVLSTLDQSVVYDDYYQYNVVENGSKTTLKLNNAAGTQVAADGSGLYMYRADSTNGYNSIVTTDNGTKVNAVGKLSGWYYSDGVLTLGTPIDPNNMTADPEDIGWNSTYLTVVDNVPIYIVNESNGNYWKTEYTTLGQIDEVYNNPAFYFQLNQYGWISLVYMVDEPTYDNSPSVAYVTGLTFNSGSALTPSAGDYLYSASALANNYTWSWNGADPDEIAITSVQWQILNTATGVYENVPSNAQAFIAGRSYRALLTLKFIGSNPGGYTIPSSGHGLSGLRRASGSSVYTLPFTVANIYT